jgi:arsenate reductase
MKKHVLFLCTGNSARSQMAEGLVNHLRGETWQAFSAGTHPTGYVHPFAIEAMHEMGVDISTARSKSVDEFRNAMFDLVITVCDDAAEECPIWLGAGKRVHIGFPDPAKGSLDDFRVVRDAIRQKIIPVLGGMK